MILALLLREAAWIFAEESRREVRGDQTWNKLVTLSFGSRVLDSVSAAESLGRHSVCAVIEQRQRWLLGCNTHATACLHSLYG